MCVPYGICVHKTNTQEGKNSTGNVFLSLSIISFSFLFIPHSYHSILIIIDFYHSLFLSFFILMIHNLHHSILPIPHPSYPLLLPILLPERLLGRCPAPSAARGSYPGRQLCGGNNAYLIYPQDVTRGRSWWWAWRIIMFSFFFLRFWKINVWVGWKYGIEITIWN